jgi:phospholipid transport system substrate-binding protein
VNKTLFILALLLVVPAASHSAAGQSSPAEIRQMLKARDAEIKGILGDRDEFTPTQKENLKNVINGIIDFETMGRNALGPHWDSISEQERSHFVEVFGDIVRSQSLSNLDVYRSAVEYQEITVGDRTAHVVTSTVYKDVPARVEYEMLFRPDGWFISDIILDDVSTTQGYSRSFQSVIRKKGFSALMTSLEKRRERIGTS